MKAWIALLSSKGGKFRQDQGFHIHLLPTELNAR